MSRLRSPDQTSGDLRFAGEHPDLTLCEQVDPVNQPFAPHPVTWTRDKSQRWWDQSGTRPGFHEHYFSKLFGDSLIRFLDSGGVPIQGRVLDFGCGPGYLLEKLAAKGVDCHGIEFSPEAVETARGRLRAIRSAGTVELVEGIPTPLGDSSFDLVFFLETLEHLLENERTPTVAELARLVRPGGLLVVTVPNQEDLERAQVLCPDCGCEFHPMQHVSSWRPSSLAGLMRDHGFETVKAKEVFLHQRWFIAKLRTAVSPMLGKTLPNLVFVGRRASR